LHKTCYLEARALLPLKNPLRWYGQSENCCPKGFYDNQIHSCTETYPFVRNADLRNVVPRTLNINNFLNLPTMVKMKTTKNNLGEQEDIDMVYEKCDTDVTDDIYKNFIFLLGIRINGIIKIINFIIIS
jgi:hypothetical protein